jgi:hypothetical protein
MGAFGHVGSRAKCRRPTAGTIHWGSIACGESCAQNDWHECLLGGCALWRVRSRAKCRTPTVGAIHWESTAWGAKCVHNDWHLFGVAYIMTGIFRLCCAGRWPFSLLAELPIRIRQRWVDNKAHYLVPCGKITLNHDSTSSVNQVDLLEVFCSVIRQRKSITDFLPN